MKKKIDYDNWSKDELIKEIKRIKETTYGLVWHRDLPEEKIDVLINPDARTPSEMFPNEMTGKPFPVLKEVKAKAIETDKNKPTNLLIEGDNYHSLAVLSFTHQESIDLIYIDPPYNTGNDDFIYSDKIESGYVRKDDPFRHSKWLSFMEKRLKLSKNLLSKNGLIFISIDDNEFAPLRMLCDEIFGEKNFVAIFKWNRTAKAPSLSNSVRTKYEYVLCFKKEVDVFLYGKDSYNTEAPLLNMPNKQTEIIFPPKSVKIASDFKPGIYSTKYQVYLIDPIKSVDGYNENEFRIKGRFKWTQRKINDYISSGQVFLVKKNLSTIYYYLETEGSFIPPSDLISFEECGVKKNTDASSELKEMNIDFDYPKPVSLIQYLIKSATYNNKKAIILDFMAGSGTTGHAVLEMNKEDGGDRKFILCTNNENNICIDVCYPRIEKVIKGYKNSKNEKIDGLGGNLKYFTAYDFVEAKETDRNKRKLVNQSTEMLCIKEGAFELVQEAEDFKIFRNHEKYLGIIFHEDSISDYVKAIKKIKGHFNTYTFSMTDDPHREEFSEVEEKVTLCAIPEVILKVYREIFKG
jgi:adenine-specific DNA-methyltransferase